MTIYEDIVDAKKQGTKKFGVLIDPDQIRLQSFESVLEQAILHRVDYFFIGGSLILNNKLDDVLRTIKQQSTIPLILFPGNSFQLSHEADALLFLSLISGRNPELLIGKHVVAAPFLKKSTLEVISTGYILIDGGKATTVSYMSNTTPIPADKIEIALCTALAGELLGLNMIYLEGGSGAQNPVSTKLVKTVSDGISIPLLVGGGIKTPEKAQAIAAAGADLIIVGNAIEENPSLIGEMADAIRSYSRVN